MDSYAPVCHNKHMSHNKPQITSESIAQINRMIDENPGMHRTALSKRLCELWNWRSETGQIKDISARDLLRALDKKGRIRLPAARWAPRSPGVGADKVEIVEHDIRPINATLKAVRPITIDIVKSSKDVRLFKSYIQQFHYLKFDRSIGESMKYFVYGNDGSVLACLMFGSSAWSCRARDDYIGWSAEQRRAGLHLVTNNSRFLILPFIRVPHLASHILGAVARRISRDWQAKYGHGLAMLETFVEQRRFRGTVYEAANWACVGETTGLGRNSATGEAVLPIKAVWLYPLCDGFREKLCGARQ